MSHGHKSTASVIFLAAAVFIPLASAPPLAANPVAVSTVAVSRLPAFDSRAPAQNQVEPQETATLFVHGEGDDSAEGSRQAPLRSITAALARARAAGGPIRVQVSIGTFSADAGEVFPLDLSGGVKLEGLGSGVAVIEAKDAPIALRLGNEVQGRAVLSGFSIRGTGVGIALGSAAPVESPQRDLVLRDVLLEGFETGLALDLGSKDKPLPIVLKTDGLRTRQTRFGLRALGEGHLILALVDADLEGGEIGVVLESDPSEKVEESRKPGEEGVAIVHHDVLLRRTRIADMSVAGVLRVGRDGRNLGGPYLFEDCSFEHNQIGVEFRRPTLDSQVRFTRTQFLSNRQFGLRLTGELGNQRGILQENRIEDCLFRWNGVGAHITSSQLPLVVRRSRFLDNRGNGLFVSNFLTAPTHVSIESSLFAQNGSHGIYSLADSRLQSVSIQNCTIVDNGAGGIRDHRRHSGSSRFNLGGCIVVGNGAQADLVDIDPSLPNNCLIDGVAGLDHSELSQALAPGHNLVASDPGFVDRSAGDYTLRIDSPCRFVPSGEEAEAWPQFDLWEKPFAPNGRSRSMGCLATIE